MVVKINQVINHESATHNTWFISKMKQVLLKQGQIEPLQVSVYLQVFGGEPVYRTFLEDPHGAEIVYAARALGWPTLLISVMKRYEA